MSHAQLQAAYILARDELNAARRLCRRQELKFGRAHEWAIQALMSAEAKHDVARAAVIEHEQQESSGE